MNRKLNVEAIKIGLTDSDYYVRMAAMEACKGRNDIPLIRTFEPPERVYKKCLGGVIVVAGIPSDAQVRGGINKKCRANKAIIKEVIGDFCGEKVGISMYDSTTQYWEGDEIFIGDFDLRNDECSTGFHFFCSIKEAENYTCQ